MTLGVTDGRAVEIIKRLDAGDQVALNPASFLTDQEKQTRAAMPVKPTPPAQAPPARGGRR